MDRAESLGYQTMVMFVFLDSPDTCVARVQQRVKRGGHSVPEEDIRRRYQRSLKNFWNSYRFAAEQWALHLNSGEESLAVASGIDDNYIVYDEYAMQRFLDVAKESS